MLYFVFAGASYYFLFDHSSKSHPKFLKNQVWREIKLSSIQVPVNSMLTFPWFWGEVKGYSQLYSSISDYGLLYMTFSVILFLFFTDACIYWIHRLLHHPILYSRIHKPHHAWKVPTPFASYAFHPVVRTRQKTVANSICDYFILCAPSTAALTLLTELIHILFDLLSQSSPFSHSSFYTGWLPSVFTISYFHLSLPCSSSSLPCPLYLCQFLDHQHS